MADATTILATLEAVSERHGDPTAQVYSCLFARHPDLERLFLMDSDGGVRASMMQQVFECVLDHVGEQRVAAQIIHASRMQHDGYGVPADRFDAFFVATRDALRGIMGVDWTPAMERAWTELLDEFAAIT